MVASTILWGKTGSVTSPGTEMATPPSALISSQILSDFSTKTEKKKRKKLQFRKRD